MSEDIFENLSGIADVALNSPMNKGSLTVDDRNDHIGLTANMRGRVVSGFPVNSGVYTGDVERYAVLDAQVGYRLNSTPNVTVTLSVQNVLHNRHAEFVGTPEIGRLLLGRVRAEF